MRTFLKISVCISSVNIFLSTLVTPPTKDKRQGNEKGQGEKKTGKIPPTGERECKVT